MNRVSVIAILLLLGACSKAPEPGTVPPAGAEERAAYGADPGDQVEPQKDAAVKELFCLRVLEEPCPADIEERLARYERGSGRTRIQLADAFVQMKAGQELGDPDAPIPDQVYVEAGYNVILGRSSDPGGFNNYLDYVKRPNGRSGMIEAMLRSQEFRS